MKVVVIGAGSTYTPELINGLLSRFDMLQIRELCLFDTDARRLDILGGLARRMVKAAGEPFPVTLMDDRRKALDGASYVVNQIRVGQMAARREDEYLGRRHGLIGQETTGVGGMANALRTIPVVLDIAADARRYAPDALFLNFTNPAGLVTEALVRYAPGIQCIGVCNVGITAKMKLLELWEERTGERLSPERAVLDTLGLNHLTWHRHFFADGRDLWPEIFPMILDTINNDTEQEWDRRTIENLRMLPNYYLQYFYYTDRKLCEQAAWPPSRAEEVMEIERDLLDLYTDPGRAEPPDDLMKRGGAYYSELATHIICDHHNDGGGIHVVNVPNAGAVPEWPGDWVLELPAKVDAAGAHPLPASPLPPAEFALIAAVKMYEILTVDAAVHGDREAAYNALLAHPLGPGADRAGDVLDDILQTNKSFLPLFFS